MDTFTANISSYPDTFSVAISSYPENYSVNIIEAQDGKSAYQLAVDNGFIGTEQEWLNSLGGTSGDYLPLSGGTITGNISASGNLDVDGNTLFVDSVNNRVGIGTNSPTRPLQVNGASQFNGNIYNNSSDPSLTLRSTAVNAANAGSIFFQTSSATESVSIVFNASTNVWRFTYGDNSLNLTSTGVGIGTTTPSEKLTVVGNISASGTITGTNLVYTDGTIKNILTISQTDYDDLSPNQDPLTLYVII